MNSQNRLSDDRRDQLLSAKRNVDQLPVKESSPQAANSRERYIGFKFLRVLAMSASLTSSQLIPSCIEPNSEPG